VKIRRGCRFWWRGCLNGRRRESAASASSGSLGPGRGPPWAFAAAWRCAARRCRSVVHDRRAGDLTRRRHRGPKCGAGPVSFAGSIPGRVEGRWCGFHDDSDSRRVECGRCAFGGDRGGCCVVSARTAEAQPIVRRSAMSAGRALAMWRAGGGCSPTGRSPRRAIRWTLR
jgi:hypothetical protein